MMNGYTPDQLVRVAKRLNNNIRSYLYVDPLQGKHIPVSPDRSLQLFRTLASLIEERYPGERFTVVAFAETATAVGNAVAYYLGSAAAVVCTTREDMGDADLLYFTESHSHATEQRISADVLDRSCGPTDRLIFVEDEITTGHTIEKLIAVLEKRAGHPLRCGIASILNSMTDESLESFERAGRGCSYICRIPHQYRIDRINGYDLAPSHMEPDVSLAACATIAYRAVWDQRRIYSTDDMRSETDRFCAWAADAIDTAKDERMLVIGTEEFMFPAMMLADVLRRDHTVNFHATTRSPIEVSESPDYPLHRRYELRSLYDADRITYIYNLERYDRVIVVTDAPESETRGAYTLINALRSCGNEHITLIRWQR